MAYQNYQGPPIYTLPGRGIVPPAQGGMNSIGPTGPPIADDGGMYLNARQAALAAQAAQGRQPMGGPAGGYSPGPTGPTFGVGAPNQGGGYRLPSPGRGNLPVGGSPSYPPGTPPRPQAPGGISTTRPKQVPIGPPAPAEEFPKKKAGYY